MLSVPFEVVPSDIDETLTAESPRALVEALALAKAEVVAATHPDRLVLGADTVVSLRDRILGKPRGEAEARVMLESLRGRAHEVTTGVALVGDSTLLVTSVVTEVMMRAYTDAELDAYVARHPPADGPYDKAGAYALQDPVFAPVAEARGCVCSVIGLPLWTTFELLKGAGLAPERPSLERCAGCPEGADGVLHGTR